MLLNHPSSSRRLAAILSIFLLNGCLEGRSDKSESGGMAIETPTAATVDAQMPSGLVTNTNQGGVMPALGGEVSDEADQGRCQRARAILNATITTPAPMTSVKRVNASILITKRHVKMASIVMELKNAQRVCVA